MPWSVKGIITSKDRCHTKWFAVIVSGIVSGQKQSDNRSVPPGHMKHLFWTSHVFLLAASKDNRCLYGPLLRSDVTFSPIDELVLVLSWVSKGCDHYLAFLNRGYLLKGCSHIWFSIDCIPSGTFGQEYQMKTFFKGGTCSINS